MQQNDTESVLEHAWLGRKSHQQGIVQAMKILSHREMTYVQTTN